MKNYLLLAVAVLFLRPQASAQNAIHGRVTDAEDGSPLYGAVIYISELKTGSATDSAGYFIIRSVPNGSFLAEVRMIGYATQAVTVYTQGYDSPGAPAADIKMVKTPAEYHPVIITGVSGTAERRRDPVPSVLQTRDHLLQHTSQNVIGNLAELPGISAVTTGNAIAKPVIRGLGYNRVVVLRNGVRQEGQQWGDEHGIEIDEFEIDRVEIIKGPGSIMYGSDAMAGVMNFITTRSVSQGTIGGEILSGYQSNGMLFSNSLMTEGNINGVSWQIRGSQKRGGNYFTPVDGYVANTGFKEYNASGFIGLNRSWGVSQLSFSSFNQTVALPEGERDSLGRFGFIVEDDIGSPAVRYFDSESLKGYTYSMGIPQQVINHHRVGLSANIYRDKSKFKFDAGFQQNNRREYGEIANPSVVGIGMQLSTATFNATYYSPSPDSSGGQLAAGISAQHQQNENIGEEYIIPDYVSLDGGAFAHYHYILDKVYLAAGVRGDLRNVTSKELYLDTNGMPAMDSTTGELKFGSFEKMFGALTAIAGMSYQPKDELVLRINASRGFRAPNIAELSSNGRHEGTFRYELGNSSLKPETSLQLDLGITFTSDHFNIDVSAFSNDIQNFIYLSKVNSVFGGDSIVDPADPAPLFTFTQGHGRLMGGEITTDLHPHPLDWLHFENSVSFVYGTLLHQPDSMKYLPFIPPVKIQSELNAHGEALGIFRHYYAGLSGAYYCAQNNFHSAFGTETATPGYFLLDAGAGTEIVNKKNEVLFKLYFSVNNILNTQYQSHLSRLKYAPENPATGFNGIYGQGRNFSVRLLIPFSFTTNKQ